MSSNKKEDARDYQAKRLIEMLEKQLHVAELTKFLRKLAGVTASDKPPIVWKRTWDSSGLPRSFVTKKQYRGSNLMMLGFAGYSCPYYLTAKQAIELGGIPDEEERSWMIVYWVFKEEEKNGKTTKRPVRCFYHRVFNISQCRAIDANSERDEKMIARMSKGRFAIKSGKPENWAKVIKETIQPITRDFEPLDAAKALHEKFENNQGPKVNHSKGRAYYSPTRDFIGLPMLSSFHSAEEYHITRFHEEIHSTGHKKRIGRPEITKAKMVFGDHDYSKEELVAEMGASILASYCGISRNTQENSLAYLWSWYTKLKDKPLILYEAARDAQTAVDFILNIDWEKECEEA